MGAVAAHRLGAVCGLPGGLRGSSDRSRTPPAALISSIANSVACNWVRSTAAVTPVSENSTSTRQGRPTCVVSSIADRHPTPRSRGRTALPELAYQDEAYTGGNVGAPLGVRSAGRVRGAGAGWIAPARSGAIYQGGEPRDFAVGTAIGSAGVVTRRQRSRCSRLPGRGSHPRFQTE
jgi:hypothetical protein